MGFQMNGQAYVINAPDVVAEDFDGKIVILNLADGRYFGLEGIGGLIWARLLEGAAPSDILASIAVQQPGLEGSASDFIRSLVEWRLIRPSEAMAGAPRVDIRETWASEAPRIEVFDDLAELIFADPIHDVDEQAGWPLPRPIQ